ncbi:MAG TPA: phosphotransferase family protein [Mycobacteriales bacterium]|jgi:aminoglycoside phosphotransferase (APT) family kinase protein|nr:phosphotransferase family protein [Mycobacteriales bacterium]
MTTPAGPAAPHGLELGAVGAWLAGHVGLELPLEVVQVVGGRSNLTYRVSDRAGRRVALRRPPAGQLLATAHDMRREWQVLRAVEDTPVPAPRPLALCEDESVTGARFYVMEWVDGLVPADATAAAALPAAARARLTLQLADVLADLHRLDPASVGLAGWARDGDYLQRQLRRWHRQIHGSGSTHLALADRVHDLLLACPAGAEDRVVHGDYRAGNVLVGPDGTVRAVLDWELATLGHPLADLGWLVASWTSAGDRLPTVTASPSELPGFGSSEELVQRYAQRSGRDVAALPVYEAFARWRSACINAGVRARYLAGAMGDDGFDVSGMDEQIREQLVAAGDLVARLPPR